MDLLLGIRFERSESMSKPSEIWAEIKPKIGEMVFEANNMESRFEKAQEEAYANGRSAGSKEAREETWDIAKRIVCREEDGGLSGEELHDIFGWRSPSLILRKFTAEEAAEKIHEWEMRKAEVRDEHEFEKGDEVIAASGKAVVTKVNAERVEYIYGNGMPGKDKKTNVKWTGKNYCAMGQIMDKLLEE